MAAPAPHWKKKTRPCPFYSQGRCLFSDSCNFVHSVKVNHEPPVIQAGVTLKEGVEEFAYGRHDGSGSRNGDWSVDTDSRVSSSLGRRSSERRRRSVMSPPRSPRLSGLLSALESVIGPDVEEFEDVEEENDDDDVERGENAKVLPNLSASGDPILSPDITQAHKSTWFPDNSNSPGVLSDESLQSDALPDLSDSLDAPPSIADVKYSKTSPETAGISFLNDNLSQSSSDISNLTSPVSITKRSLTLRARAPSPIVIRHHQNPTIESNVLDANSLEIRTHHPQSTFDLLSSPFPSPALRLLSPQIFPTREPVSPVFGSVPGSSTRTMHYSDDDLESLETLGSSAGESGEQSSSSSLESSFNSEIHSDDSLDSIETSESSTESLEGVGLDLDSPRETERPASDYFYTPRNPPRRDDLPVSELDDLPPLPPSLTRNSDVTDKRQSQIAFPTFEQDSSAHHPLPMSVENDPGDPGSSRSWSTSPVQCAEPSVGRTLTENNEIAGSVSFRDDRPASATSHEGSYDLLSYTSPGPATIPSKSRDLDSFSDWDTVAYYLHDSSPKDKQLPSSSSSLLAPISTVWDGFISLDSPTNQSLVPSPVSAGLHSSYTSDTLVEPDNDSQTHESLHEWRVKTGGSSESSKCLTVTSPTKLLREMHSPESLEKTVRAAPSPLHEEAARPSSSRSSASSDSHLSWVAVSKKAGAAQKIPFGFRQSLLLDQAQSSVARNRSQRSSMASHASSTSSSSPTLASQPRSASRLDLLSGRARSVSPAAFAAGSSRQGIAFPTQPRSASQLDFVSNRSRPVSALSFGGSEPSSSSPPTWMRPLRLSQIVHSPILSDQQASLSVSAHQNLSIASVPSFTNHTRNISQGSSVNHDLLSSARSSSISAYLNDSDIPTHDISPITDSHGPHTSSLDSASSSAQPTDRDTVMYRHSRSVPVDTNDAENALNLDLLSPLSGSMRGFEFDDMSRWNWPDSDSTLKGFPSSIHSEVTSTVAHAPALVEPSVNKSTPITTYVSNPSHAIATPRPTLIFAIASDDPVEVERVLAHGEARPNDDVGPQSALEFALTNDGLAHKTEIVKLLLAYGADPGALSAAEMRAASMQHAKVGCDEDEIGEEEGADILAELPPDESSTKTSKTKKRESVLNPAMKYYLNRASAAQSSAVLRRTDFRPLARMRFDFIGQDRALEHLYWVLGMHSQQPIGTPLVVLCCGPSGHGKSLLARKFGSLLDVPTHTVNMTILKTSHDLWECPSMSPYDQPSERTLAEFLSENAGKRCVVVLDEIDKNEDDRTLWSLLAPWELGRCSIDAGRRHIDVRNVIWLGTSNIGQDLVFEHHDSRKDPDSTAISKAEYRDLMGLLRPRVSERLGTSLMSRVTAVLPFVPFTDEEKLAIASEAVLALGGEMASELSPDEFERLAARCVSEYVMTEGARSLYRSVSTHLMDTF